MVRLAPGFDSDTQQLDPRLSHESVEALRAQRAANSNIVTFCIHYLAASSRGEFGKSLTFNRSVKELIAERLPVTLRMVASGLAIGWMLTIFVALSAAALRFGSYDAIAGTVAGALLCIPAAALGLFFAVWRTPASLAIALVVFPHAFRYARDLVVSKYEAPHVVTARAKGLGPLRVLFFHVLPVCAAPLLALAGVSVTIALGAAVPVEVLCGIPGIGQLAWQAALGRDLSLLVTLTMLVTMLAVSANSAADLLNSVRPRVVT
jgi:peptide/nickel transport system permease protein